MKLKSIAEEAKACRHAFKHSKIGDLVVHCHHSELEEKLTEPAESRIQYILSDKPTNEQALRLRLFRPVKGTALAEYDKVKETLHTIICKTKGCTWDGKTIFP